MLPRKLNFDFMVDIKRPVADVFAFFRDIERHAGQPGTVVPVYDKITPGPAGIGTRYREVVQIAPLIRGEIITVVTGYEENRRLVYLFSGMGMDGELTYSFESTRLGTRVTQKQVLRPGGFLRLLAPLIQITFYRMAGRRLNEIRDLLERE